MHILNILLLTCFCLTTSFGKLSITKITMREPRRNDIGLIFDVTVINAESAVMEMLEYRIRSDGTCRINVSSACMMNDAGRVVGGNFGYIEAGKTDTVSLIWPTLSLYNRVGYCPIIVTSTNPLNKQVQFRQIVRFDSRFEALDPDKRTFRKHKDFMECNNWDKDYFQNCTPVNCEKRYFGRRSFYNESTERCDAVPVCKGRYDMYDPWANECIDSKRFCNTEDIEKIRRGDFENNVLDLKIADPGTPNLVINALHECDGQKIRRNVPLDPAYARHGMRITANERVADIMHGVMLVFATIVIYGIICFIIYLIVAWISRTSYQSGSDAPLIVIKPATSSNHLVLTPSSLLSHR